MNTRLLFIAVFGAALFVPPASTAFADPGAASSPFRIAQAGDARKSKDEDDDRKAKRTPKKDTRANDRAKPNNGNSNAARDAQNKAKAERDAKAKADREAKQKARVAQDAKEKADREAKQKARAAQDAKEKADREAKQKARAERDAKDKADREAKKKDRDDAKNKNAKDRGKSDNAKKKDDDRKKKAAERPKRGEGNESAQRRMKEQESKKTSSQDISRRQLRPGERYEIDGGHRTLRRDGNRLVIRGNDNDRLWTGRGDRRIERLPNNQTRTVVIYPDGTQVITITGSRGEIVRRWRRDRFGRDIILVREVTRPPLVRLDLGPLRIAIPREQYIVEARRASRPQFYAALAAPPVEPIQQAYTLEEVREFDRLRDTMPRIDIDTITFETDSAVITPDQAQALEGIAGAMLDLIDNNPSEVFMIEGYTDAPGDEAYNLALSDRRAEAVAIALTEYFNVPPENLVTQGYGEQFPKIPTELAEIQNRRVAVRRVTPLVGAGG